MATKIGRLEFKQHYENYSQGLFILMKEKRIPKDQAVINVGQQLSLALCDVPENERVNRAPVVLAGMLSAHRSVTMTHPNVLFTPGLKIDVIRTLLSLCRNRKICLVWPGTMLDGKLFYATPDSPEYYECDPSALQDTYIIND